MIKEMADIWSCSWKPDVMQVVAKQMVGVALAQGVVEWSGQALLSVAKLHGSSWLAAGTMQALGRLQYASHGMDTTTRPLKDVRKTQFKSRIKK